MICLTFKVINSMIMKNMKQNELKFNREQLRCVIHCVLTVIKCVDLILRTVDSKEDPLLLREE